MSLAQDDLYKLAGVIPDEGNDVDGNEQLANSAFTRVKILSELGAPGAADVKKALANVVSIDQKYFMMASEILGGDSTDASVVEIRKKYGRSLQGIHKLANALRDLAVSKLAEENLTTALNKANNTWDIKEIGNPMGKNPFK